MMWLDMFFLNFPSLEEKASPSASSMSHSHSHIWMSSGRAPRSMWSGARPGEA